ncbi:MAG: sugar phosphate isomerase/epimerase [Kiritimatiellae bacterium]|nr:sugar phosphate isomerase/epimerase [Kiritimatiellia bacterium]
MHLIRRRDWLKESAVLAALAALPARLQAAGAKIPIGLQLYSVRRECAEDLPGVLAAVAKMGYRGVEFAGYHGRTAAQLKAMLDDVGLVCCGTHTGWPTIQPDQLGSTIEFNRTLGNPYLIVPGLPKACVESVEACRKTAATFTQQAEVAAAQQMYVGYHAHGGDFRRLENGETVWDTIFSNAGPKVVMQLDTGNCLGGGGDPVATLKRYPGRSLTIHLKEHGGPKGAAVGEGQVPWAQVFEICETTGGTRWYIVEHETGERPMESVRRCFENLAKMGKT